MKTPPPMTANAALKILIAHNKWRRDLLGEFILLQSPKDIGYAIDIAVKALREAKKQAVKAMVVQPVEVRRK